MNSKTAFVTGGSSAIGRHVALGFARRGATVAVAAHRPEGAEATAEAVRELGGKAFPVLFDARDPDAVREAVDEVADRFGGIDYAVNNVGGTLDISGNVVDLALDDWDTVMDLNLKAAWLCLKYELTHMQRAGHGAIVNNIGALGVRAVTGMSAYVAAKHALVGLTKTAALEAAPLGVRINGVAPSMTVRNEPPDVKESRAAFAAQKIPLGRISEAEEAAQCAVWLCSDEASFVVGHVLVVDGGLTTTF